MLEQVQQRRFGPVDVLDDAYQWPLPRLALKEAAHRPERLLGPGRLAREPDRAGDQLANARAVRLLVDDPNEAVGEILGMVMLLGTDDRAHDLGDRPVGDALAIRQAAAVDDARRLAGARRELA